MDPILKETCEVLAAGGIAVVRTDTLYGIIARAADSRAVEKVYAAKHRDVSKQCIVLVTGSGTIGKYSAQLAQYGGLDKRPTSVVVPATTEQPWVLRGGNSIAYRVVRDEFLRQVVRAVGPVIAPSANPEGLEPARTIEEARQYFGDTVDIYVDGGVVPQDVAASRIIKVRADGSAETLRS